MGRSPRIEILSIDFIAWRRTSAHLTPIKKKGSGSRGHPTKISLTKAIIIAELIFLLVFIGVVKLLGLSDTQSTIVAISLAITLISILLAWYPERAELFEKVGRLFRLK